ncbi:hypothetical protein EDB86DRAFT_2829547 [Lactarius hatsudake]|nr:hypothetical protein EDB86DRAFT_2829547 [Lactarius hatsudake]
MDNRDTMRGDVQPVFECLWAICEVFGVRVCGDVRRGERDGENMGIDGKVQCEIQPNKHKEAEQANYTSEFETEFKILTINNHSCVRLASVSAESALVPTHEYCFLLGPSQSLLSMWLHILSELLLPHFVLSDQLEIKPTVRLTQLQSIRSSGTLSAPQFTGEHSGVAGDQHHVS